MATYSTSLQNAKTQDSTYLTVAKHTKDSKKDFSDLTHHAISIQAAKIEVLVSEFKPILGNKFWTDPMLKGLNEALQITGLTIINHESSEPLKPSHNALYNEKYLTVIHHSSLTKNLSETIQELAEDGNELVDLGIEDKVDIELAQRALITQSLQDEVAKIAALIQDFLSATPEANLQSDALASIKYALELGNRTLDTYKSPTSQQLFARLANKHSSKEKGTSYLASKDSELQKNFVDVVLQILNDLKSDDAETIDPALLQTLSGKYDSHILSYVKKITSETTSLDNLKAELESHNAYFTKLAVNRVTQKIAMMDFLLSIIGDFLDLDIENQRSFKNALATNMTTSKKVIEASQQVYEKIQNIIDQYSTENSFNLDLFLTSYTENSLILNYVQALIGIMDSVNLNAEQMKKQMKKHFEAIEKQAIEKEREVTQKRNHQKADQTREERRVQKSKRENAKNKDSFLASTHL